MSVATDSTLRYLSPKNTTAPAPRVTVVMPTYRRAAQIGASVRSLLTGRFADFELLVRDDGNGEDGTAEAVRDVAAGDARVRYHRNERNLRMPGNLNAGILEARGDYIAVCHDHDLYKPDFLAEMVAALDRHPSALYVHCAIDVVGQDDRQMQTHIGDWNELTPGREWLRFMLRSLSCPVCALTLVRRTAHEQYGLYDPAFGFISDVEMWMRLASKGDVAYINRPLINVREREEDHVATKESVRWILTAGEIHRSYLGRSYHGIAEIFQRLMLEKKIFLRSSRERLSVLIRSCVDASQA
jgi:glycosyltransferase involved in cell wall biosynthesis